MKISGIDKDFEDIIYYLDKKGLKPFASCDGVEKNHEDPNDLYDAYISFLDSPRILDLMTAFIEDEETFRVSLNSEDHYEPRELYGNIISGSTYVVYFYNREGETTEHFKDIIKNTLERETLLRTKTKEKLEQIDKVLKANSDTDLTFEISINAGYETNAIRIENVNELIIMSKAGREKIEGDTSIQTERDMQALADILAKKFDLQENDNDDIEYLNSKFINSRTDKCMCSIYFTDEYLPQMLQIVEYARSIAHTLPTFESKEWIGEIGDIDELEDYEIPIEEIGEATSDIPQWLKKALEIPDEKEITNIRED